jgi:divalent metal cation (Fe/Co/Zn/Cd) transporter
MEINTLIVLYVVGILAEIGIIFIKPRFLSALPIVATCISFLVLKEGDIFNLSLIQCGICFVGNITLILVNRYRGKKKNDAIAKSELKDL